MTAVLLIYFVVPVTAALAIRWSTTDRLARTVAFSTASIMLTTGFVIAAARVLGGDAKGELPGLRVDGFNAIVLPLVAGLLLAVLMLSPRREAKKGELATLLLTAASGAGVVCAANLGLLTVLWIASLLPAWFQLNQTRTSDGRVKRTYAIFLLGSSLPIAVAVLLIAWLGFRTGVPHPFAVAETIEHGVPQVWQGPLFLLFLFGISMRMAIVPFHSWLPVLVERGPIGIGVLLVCTQVGFAVLVRVVMPMFPLGWTEGLPLLTTLGLLSATYGAVLAVSQTELRRMVGFLAVGHSGLLLLGLAARNEQAVSGALLQCVSSSLTIGGLLLLVGALQARLGVTDASRLGGLARRSPRFAVLFLVLSFASIGFPGTLGFVSEDLLLHGMLEHHPLLALTMLLSTAINGITLWRAFSRTFLGPMNRQELTVSRSMEDLLPRERWAAVALCTSLVLMGLMPQSVLKLVQ